MEADTPAQGDKIDWMDCCSTGSTIGGHRLYTVEPVLQQSIQSNVSASAGVSASAAILCLGRWISHKSTDPIVEWLEHAYPG